MLYGALYQKRVELLSIHTTFNGMLELLDSIGLTFKDKWEMITPLSLIHLQPLNISYQAKHINSE